MKKTNLMIAAILMLSACKSGNVNNKLLGGVPIDSDSLGGGGGGQNTGTIQARKDETIEGNIQALKNLGLYGQLTSSFGSAGFLSPAPNPPGDMMFDSATGFYTMDTGSAEFSFKMRFNDSNGNALQVIENNALQDQVKSVRTVVSFGAGAETFSADLTYTYSVVGDETRPQTLSGTISGSSTVDLEEGGAATSSFVMTFSNFSSDYDTNGDLTQNGSYTLRSTYPGGAISQSVTLTNLLVDSNQLFVSGRMDISGASGGETFSGTLTFTGGVGTGTFTFGTETVTVNLNADGTGTYTDATGTHPIS